MATRAVGAALAAAFSLSGCAFSGIDLVRDTRITITSPGNGDTVTVPFTVRWDARDFPAGTQFAVFVDATVVRRGQPLRAVVPDEDTRCLQDPGCPDEDYLARRGVYVTTGGEVVVPRVARSEERRRPHRISIVPLVDGRRDGEGVFSRTVYVDADR